jgi:multidrug resistance efflux pump
MVGLLLVISVVNLILVLVDRSRFSAALTKQNDELMVLTRRVDSSEKAYAQLRGQVEVTSEKLGLTPEDLKRAQALASGVQRQQQAAVQQLYQAIRQRALNDPSIYPIF